MCMMNEEIKEGSVTFNDTQYYGFVVKGHIMGRSFRLAVRVLSYAPFHRQYILWPLLYLFWSAINSSMGHHEIKTTTYCTMGRCSNTARFHSICWILHGRDDDQGMNGLELVGGKWVRELASSWVATEPNAVGVCHFILLISSAFNTFGWFQIDAWQL